LGLGRSLDAEVKQGFGVESPKAARFLQLFFSKKNAFLSIFCLNFC